ncbi:hypothetical protein ACFFHM_17175 [Halalkalibacter kiskunsagensis]|uniref:Uncharacterized protein n=1 Tax=Halalkalibacter kiskunsagensis TaxID=1548599 RepID=A0ABV6KFV2_9BACI
MSDNTLSNLISHVHSDDFREMCKEFKIKVDYSPKSIKQLEKELPFLFDTVEDDLKLKVSILFAVYFGEVLKHTFEGMVEWGSYYPVEPEKTELKIMTGESEAILRPVLAIRNFIYKGEPLSNYVNSVESIVNSSDNA